MDAYAAATLLLVGIIAGGLGIWLLRGRELDRLADQLRSLDGERAANVARIDSLAGELQLEKVEHARTQEIAARSSALESELNEMRDRLARALEAKARLEVAGAAEERAHAGQVAALTTLRGEIEISLKALAAEALQGNQASFLTLAEQAFDKHKQVAVNLLDQKEKAIADLLAPINASLQEYRKGLGEIEKAREAAYGALAARLQEVARAQDEVSRETRRLVTALRAPQTRGRWGEQQLKNVIELAGMAAHVDYVPQQTIEVEERRLRPDLIIRVPGDRRIVVDAKTPLLAYLDAVEASDDALREQHLRRHAQQLRGHMKQLSEKRYWEALQPLTPDFVVMFIPGENFYAAAAERDPRLFEDAITARVLIVTPTTMIALARTIASGWDQAKLAEDARQIADLGRDLYQRLSVMGGHIAQLGTSLERSVKHYNSFVGSIESSVMPKARRFTELARQDDLPELRPIEIDAREPRGDRDLILHPSGEIVALPAMGPREAAE
jgi:DNA recombination protein RmuC